METSIRDKEPTNTELMQALEKVMSVLDKQNTVLEKQDELLASHDQFLREHDRIMKENDRMLKQQTVMIRDVQKETTGFMGYLKQFLINLAADLTGDILDFSGIGKRR